MFLSGNEVLRGNDISCPFNAKSEIIDEGKFEQGWIIDNYREPYDKIFDSLNKNDGKVVHTGMCMVIIYVPSKM